jgi:non-ribosomal peptide synthetase component F
MTWQPATEGSSSLENAHHPLLLPGLRTATAGYVTLAPGTGLASQLDRAAATLGVDRPRVLAAAVRALLIRYGNPWPDAGDPDTATLATLSCAATGPGPVLPYAREAFEPGALDRITAHLRTLLAAALADPHTPVADLPILPADELDLVIRRCNATATTYPRTATVVSLFTDQAQLTPDAVAATGRRRTLTYLELDLASARLAARLRGRGVRPGALVGLDLAPGPDALVAVLGVARVGAAFVAVGLAHHGQLPTESLRGSAGVAPREAGRPGRARVAPLLVVTDADLAGLDGEGADDPPGPDDLAYVTGTRGVAVSHGALVNVVLALRDALGPGPQHWLAYHPLVTSRCLVELFLPLATGGSVVFEDPSGQGGRPDPATPDRVTHVQVGSQDRTRLATGGLRSCTVLADGLGLPADLARDLRATAERLVVGFGCAETGGWALIGAADADGAVRISRPLANTQAYLLDDRLRPVPVGLAGEMWIGGSGLADGSLGQLDRTRAVFRPDPYGPPGSRLFRSRLFGRRDADGGVTLSA